MKHTITSMIALLQSYLRINTSYPTPDYAAAVALLRSHAMSDGFVVREILLPSGNPVLVVTLQGSSHELPALALNHHMDVVPADNSGEWTYPPFAGTIHDDILYGRGTQDCKGLGIAQYAALRMLKQSGVIPERTIHWITVPDEERGGFCGTKEFIEHPVFAELNIGYLLDEGIPSGDRTCIDIKIDERTPLQLRITSVGVQGHAASVRHLNCIHQLTQFLQQLIKQFAVDATVADHDLGRHPSVHVTSLRAQNEALNVIPSHATATVDIRVPSLITFATIIDTLDALVGEHTTITYEILATSHERYCASEDMTLYNALSEAIRVHNLEPRDTAFQATTDARFYTHRGIVALGCTPFSSIPNLHGTNESIHCDDFERGMVILYTFLQLFCTSHKGL